MDALDEAAVVNESITTTNDSPVLSDVANDSPKKNLRMKFTLIIMMLNTEFIFNKLTVILVYSGPLKTVLYEGLQEKDVGITEYTTSTAGLSGILKHRLK